MASAQPGSGLRRLRRAIQGYAADGLSDEELLRRFVAAREEAAFAALVRRHGPMVLGVCQRVLRNRQDAEDAFQATFVVLVRRASSLREPARLGSWLYVVASRVARAARGRAARRSNRERQAAPMPPTEPPPDGTWQELRTLLDEELGQLPEEDRALLVLCYLEGQTHESAARALGLPLGSMTRRLARARALLRQRLVQRGVTLSTAALATALGEAEVMAVLPAPLVAATVKAGLLTAAGRAAGVVGGEVLALAEGVLKAMSATRTALLALVLVLGALGLGTGLLAPTAPTVRSAEAHGEPARPAGKGKRNEQPPAPPRLDRHGDPLPEGAVARLGTVRLRHPGWSPALTFSPDGKTLISGNEDNRVCHWDVTTGRLLRTMPVTKERRLLAFQLAPDGKVLAVGGYDGVQLRDLATGKELGRLSAGGVGALAFTPDGGTLITGSYEQDGAIRLWDLKTGKEVRSFQPYRRGVDLVACTPHGTVVVSASRIERKIHFTRLATGETLRTIHDPAVHLEGVAVSPDGKLLAVSEYRWQAKGPALTGVRVLDLATGKEWRRFDAPEGTLHALAFTPDGRALAVSGQHQAVWLWDLTTGRERWRRSGLPDGVQRLVFSPDGKTLAGTDGSVGILHLWDAATGKPLHPDDGPAGYVRCVAFSGDGKILAAACACERGIRLWNPTTGEQVGTLMGHDRSFIWSLAVAPDGKALASGGNDGTVRVWDLQARKQTGKLLLPPYTEKELQRFGRPANQVAFSGDGKRLLALSAQHGPGGPGEAVVMGWDRVTGREVFRRQGPGMLLGVSEASFAPDGVLLARPVGRAILLEEVATGKERRTLQAPEYTDSPLVFSPDGRLLAMRTYIPREDGGKSWVEGHKVRVFDLTTGREKVCLSVDRLHRPLAFARDGKVLATASNRHAHLWEVASGRERWRSPDLDTWPSSTALAPDGRRLVIGLSDTTALVFDLAAGL